MAAPTGMGQPRLVWGSHEGLLLLFIANDLGFLYQDLRIVSIFGARSGRSRGHCAPYIRSLCVSPIKEVLRFIPPVGGGFRETIQDCEFNGYLIPKGWSFLYQVGKTHRDSSLSGLTQIVSLNTIYSVWCAMLPLRIASLRKSCLYREPERFDPDRFAPDRAEDKQKRFGYIPFGGGLRECLGKEFAKLEMKIFAAMLEASMNGNCFPSKTWIWLPCQPRIPAMVSR